MMRVQFKKLFLATVFFVVAGGVWAQGIGPMPSSPNASLAVSGNDMPVSHYTGTPNIELPIYTVTSRTISVPISLSYDARGIKVDQMASNVGLGWTLNAGGLISQLVNGTPDVFMPGGPYPNFPPSFNSPNTVINTAYASRPYDGLWDKYSMSFLGRFFSFFQASSVSGFKCIPNQTLFIYPYCFKPSSWAPNSTVPPSAWVVDDESGLRYFFGLTTLTDSSAYEITRSKIVDQWGNLYPNSAETRTLSWYLKKIVARDGSDSAFFDYDTFVVNNDFYVSYNVGDVTTYSNFRTPNCTLRNIPNLENPYQIRTKIIKGIRLRQIRYATGRVEFVSGGVRQDLPWDVYLQYINIYDNNGLMVRQTKFNYDYFTSPNYTGSVVLPVPANEQYKFKRLKLLSVEQVPIVNGAPQATGALATSFLYNESSALPPRHYYSQDYWGYFGVANTNWTRRNDPDTNNVRAWIIKSITSPLGGVTAFEFESNDGLALDLGTNTWQYAQTGGLRVRRITAKPKGLDNDSLNLVRTFIYKDSTGSSSGRFYYRNNQVYVTSYGVEIQNSQCAGGYYYRSTDTYVNTSPDLMPEIGGGWVGYKLVTEQYSGSGKMGRTVSRFTTIEENPDSLCYGCVLGYVNTTSQDWLRGRLRWKLTQKRNSSSSYSPVSFQTFNYTSPVTIGTVLCTTGYRVPAYDVNGNMTWDNRTGTYKIKTGNIFLKRTGTTQYTDDGSALLVDSTIYEYNQESSAQSNLNVARVKQIRSDGRWTVQELKRIVDYGSFNSLPGTGTDFDAMGFLAKTGRQFTVVESLNAIDQTATTGDQRVYLGGTLYRFGVVSTAVGGNWNSLANAFAFTATSPIPAASFTPSFLSNATLNYDSRYRLSGVIEQYNSLGQPTRTNDRFRVPSSVRYGYNSTRLVASVKNGNLTSNDGDATAGHIGFEEPCGTGTYERNGEERFENNGNPDGRFKTSEAYTGQYVLRWNSTAGNTVLHKSYRPNANGDSYVFSAWIKSGRSVKLRMYVSNTNYSNWSDQIPNSLASETYNNTANANWQLVTARLDLGRVRASTSGIPGNAGLRICVLISVDPGSGDAMVDEVRFAALDAAMSTTSYDDFGRVLDVTDAANNTVRYQYDSFGRLQYTWSHGLDGVRRLLEKKEYLMNYTENGWSALNPVITNTALKDMTTTGEMETAIYTTGFGGNWSDVNRHRVNYDGLGRMVSSIQNGASPGGNDVIQMFDYDSRGLQPRQYLPYTALYYNGQKHNVQVETGWKSKQLAFYTNSQNGTNNLPTDSKPFVDATYEASPAARVLSQGMVGNNWTGKSSAVTTRLNSSADNAYTFTPQVQQLANLQGNPSWTALAPQAAPIGSLLVATSTDVDGRQQETFTDLEGRTVLTRVRLQNTPTGGNANDPQWWAETYYVYDDFNRLAFVLQPNAVQKMRADGNWWAHSYEVPALRFDYKYDQYGRLVEKWTPGGGGWEYILYNLADMPIATQSSKMRNAQTSRWNIIRYDALGRKVVSGLWDDQPDWRNFSSATYRQDLQNALNGDLANYPQFETRLSVSGNPSSISPDKFYTANVFWTERAGYTPFESHTANFYDDYDANLDGADDVTLTAASGYGGTLMTSPRHKPTLTYTRVLGTNTFLESAVAYDVRGRVAQTRETTYLGGYTLTHLKYDTRGQVIQKLVENQRAPSAPVYQYWNQYTYDHRGRLKNIDQKTGTNTNLDNAPFVNLAGYGYNELGQQVRKLLHYTGTQWLQQVDYTYNIQGWLTSINNPDNLGNNKLWGMRLGYETRDVPWWANDEFGGNITTQTWRANGEPRLHRYFYSYDRANRLMSEGNGMGAFYINQDPTTGALTRAHWYHQAIHGYDRNGNLTRFQNLAGDSTAAGTNLYYVDEFSVNGQIALDGNRLRNVYDGANSLNIGDFKDNTATATGPTEYTHDVSGNMTGDINTGVTLEYNHLNLVTKITKGTGTIEYLYAADGALLQRKVNGTVAQEWMGGFVYKENGALDYIFTPEGRVVRNTAGAFEYEYHYTDQVGSLRLAWRAQNSNGTWIAAPTEVYNYYPYGLRIPQQAGTPTTAHTYPYRFTGQWNETALGLNYYHFEARLYDPALGRWTGVDPMASVNASYSPYNYVLGNPINLIDPDGRMQMIPDYNPSPSDLSNWDRLLGYAGRGGGGSGAFSGWLSGSGFGERTIYDEQKFWAMASGFGGSYLISQRIANIFAEMGARADRQQLADARAAAQKEGGWFVLDYTTGTRSNPYQWFHFCEVIGTEDQDPANGTPGLREASDFYGGPFWDLSAGFAAWRAGQYSDIYINRPATLFGKLSLSRIAKALSFSTKALGAVTFTANAVSLYFDYTDPQISSLRFSYRVSSFTIATYLTAATGNPIIGGITQGLFWLGEKAFDNIIYPGFNLFNGLVNSAAGFYSAQYQRIYISQFRFGPR